MTDTLLADSMAECSYRVIFVSVGRNHKSWETMLDHMPSEDELVKLVRKAKTLGSSDIECVFDDDLEYGTVIVGGFRPVGSFRVEAQDASNTGTRVVCPHCHRMVLVRKDGKLRQHFKPNTYYHCIVGGSAL